mmetsp:Transcript_30524/g.65743  ORF Transcript_30524/g.65743 Transcript_30524/m.65743 type:complete len:230 (+) Transcript_30524:232-921(+)
MKKMISRCRRGHRSRSRSRRRRRRCRARGEVGRMKLHVGGWEPALAPVLLASVPPTATVLAHHRDLLPQLELQKLRRVRVGRIEGRDDRQCRMLVVHVRRRRRRRLGRELRRDLSTAGRAILPRLRAQNDVFLGLLEDSPHVCDRFFCDSTVGRSSLFHHLSEEASSLLYVRLHPNMNLSHCLAILRDTGWRDVQHTLPFNLVDDIQIFRGRHREGRLVRRLCDHHEAI